MTRFLKLVTKQEKKYKNRLLPYNNFYRQEFMIQQFLQIYVKSQPSQIRRDLSLIVSCVFGQGYRTAL